MAAMNIVKRTGPSMSPCLTPMTDLMVCVTPSTVNWIDNLYILTNFTSNVIYLFTLQSVLIFFLFVANYVSTELGYFPPHFPSFASVNSMVTKTNLKSTKNCSNYTLKSSSLGPA